MHVVVVDTVTLLLVLELVFVVVVDDDTVDFDVQVVFVVVDVGHKYTFQ